VLAKAFKDRQRQLVDLAVTKISVRRIFSPLPISLRVPWCLVEVLIVQGMSKILIMRGKMVAPFL